MPCYNNLMKHAGLTIAETQKTALHFVASLKPHRNSAFVVGLSGDLGSGKTTFVKFLGEALGVRETITSPTFVIEKIYKLSGQKFKHLIHIDAYRLTSGKELLVLGWNEIACAPENLIFIEWPECVADVIKKPNIIINFSHVVKAMRSIEIVEQ